MDLKKYYLLAPVLILIIVSIVLGANAIKDNLFFGTSTADNESLVEDANENSNAKEDTQLTGGGVSIPLSVGLNIPTAQETASRVSTKLPKSSGSGGGGGSSGGGNSGGNSGGGTTGGSTEGNQSNNQSFTETCSDTDNGTNITIKGTVSGLINETAYSYTDYCLNSNYVVDYYCQATYNFNNDITGYVWKNGTWWCSYFIPNAVCFNGACVPYTDINFTSECNDGIDNLDADNLTDYPNDPGCFSVVDTNEIDGQCDDGLDNSDADNLTDYPNDPGCSSFTDTSEADGDCEDGTDNDQDGFTDYPNDPECTSYSGKEENCVDTDGYNFNVLGMVSGSRGGVSYNYTDYCEDSNYIREYYCLNTGGYLYTKSWCAYFVPGSVCVGGICVVQTNATTTTTSTTTSTTTTLKPGNETGNWTNST